MIVRIDPASAMPPFEQIRHQVRTMASTGVLPVGARLPTIRQLSKDLGVAGGTVARAYRELEADGVIVTRGRHGSFVAEMRSDAIRDVPDDVLIDAARTFALHARQLGADRRHAVKILNEAFESLGTS
jgi:DNA-binding transcriptional regulator YhcF (GntR family)